jgi:uncharacterized protein DUF5996
MTNEGWPALPYEEWKDTRDTLHMWTQIVGKIRLALTPRINHWWNVPLYITARGLTTSEISYGERWFDMEFDFIAHVLRIRTSDGTIRNISLAPRTVADFYREIMSTLRALGIDVRIWTVPSEVPNPIRFEEDEVHRSYDPSYVDRFWRIIALTEGVLMEFRSRFIGKCSPIHFFWGGFDLAVSRFSGRVAPPREGADSITREGYSHEVSSLGWWPGDPRFPHPAFYSYIAPEPAGFKTAKVLPDSATYDPNYGLFVLSYEDARREQSPDKALLDFAQTTYDAAADLAKWDRSALERA